jgi:hypothetical protein
MNYRFKLDEMAVELKREEREYQRIMRDTAYHLRDVNTGKILCKGGKPSKFQGYRHAIAVAEKLKFGTWEAVRA